MSSEIKFTERQKEAMRWVGHGLNNREIGLRMDISEHTVKFYVTDFLVSFGCTSKLAMTVTALKLGYLKLEELNPVRVPRLKRVKLVPMGDR